MKQRHGTSEYMDSNIFYSYSALMLVFDVKVAKIMKKKWGISNQHLRYLAAVRLFMNTKGKGAMVSQIMKLLETDKFHASRTLKVMREEGILKRKKVKNAKNAYEYFVDRKGVAIIQSWTSIMKIELEKFWEDRRRKEYRFIKLDKNFRPILRNRELKDSEKID